jgi:type IV secretion system protein VirB11
MSPALHAVTSLSEPRSEHHSDDQIFGDALPRDVVIRGYLAPLKEYLSAHGATEVWINKPGELIIQTEKGDITIIDPAFDFAYLQAFATSIAVYSPQQQSVSVTNPLLSATLPDGERIQVALPPVVEPGTVSMSIRIPSVNIIALDEYEQDGAFGKYAWPRPTEYKKQKELLQTDDLKLVCLLAEGRLREFLIEAVRARKNIGVVGDTGSGKTTLMKSMCQHIFYDERIITIEDVRELMLPEHTNCVHLLYSKNAQSVAKVTPGDLIAAAMRMAPKRALLAELRGSEAWDFLKLLTSGHSGSITSWHAESCSLAFERFMFMAKENLEAATLSREEIKHLVSLTLDVVVHIKREMVMDASGEQSHYIRYVDEVHFDPWSKMTAQFGDLTVERAAGG